jgi:hypothetical protein
MTVITEAAFKKYWVVGAVAATLVAGGAAWATAMHADVEGLKASMAEVLVEQRGTAHQIQLLREAMIRAGTALPVPKGD